jgi:hypothetical protein
MRKVGLILWLAVGCVSLQTQRGFAGPEWVEDDDAGHLPPNAQRPQGTGSMSSIAGQLAAVVTASSGLDTVDMYAIFISNPQEFMASTSLHPLVPGNANFDSQLWLFDRHGRGVLGNDDAQPAVSGSFIAFPPNDGTGQPTPPPPGLYFLAVTAFDTDPFSSGGQPLFNQVLRTEISGPDGSGGGSPVAAWGTSTMQGSYLIRLQGVEFPPAVPAVSSWGLLVLFFLLAIAGSIVQRRQANALTCD